MMDQENSKIIKKIQVVSLIFWKPFDITLGSTVKFINAITIHYVSSLSNFRKKYLDFWYLNKLISSNFFKRS